jgi:hypothetical protein
MAEQTRDSRKDRQPIRVEPSVTGSRPASKMKKAADA